MCIKNMCVLFRSGYIHKNNLKILFMYINNIIYSLNHLSIIYINFDNMIYINHNNLIFLNYFYGYKKKRFLKKQNIRLWNFLFNVKWNKKSKNDNFIKNFYIKINIKFQKKLKKLRILKNTSFVENKSIIKLCNPWEKTYNKIKSINLSVEKLNQNDLCNDLFKIKNYYNKKVSLNQELYISIENFKNYKKELNNSDSNFNNLKVNWNRWNDLFLIKKDNSFTELNVRYKIKNLKKFYNFLLDQSLVFQYKRIKLKIITLYYYVYFLFSKYEKLRDYIYSWLKVFYAALSSEKRFLISLDIPEIVKDYIDAKNYLRWRKSVKTWHLKKILKCEKWYEEFTSVPINTQNMFLKEWKNAYFTLSRKNKIFSKTLYNSFDSADSYRVAWWRKPLQNYLHKMWEAKIHIVKEKLIKINMTLEQVYENLNNPLLLRYYLNNKLIKILTQKELELLLSYLDFFYIKRFNDYYNKEYKLGSYYKVEKTSLNYMLHLNGRPYEYFDRVTHIKTFEHDKFLKTRVIY